MIKEVKGNLLDVTANIYAHQVNCKGRMGAGVARQIKDRWLEDDQFEDYRRLCASQGCRLLGHVQYMKIRTKNKGYIANLFAQESTGYIERQTDYQALYDCMVQLEKTARQKQYTVAIPMRIGCGLAGGSWAFVYNNIIKPIFENSPVLLIIVEYDK